MKRTAVAGLLLTITFVMTGCRIPLVDPPIVGRWAVVNTPPGSSVLYEFKRDMTGRMEIVSEIIEAMPEAGDGASEPPYTEKAARVAIDFTWAYTRAGKRLVIEGPCSVNEFEVDFNFFQTKASLNDPSGVGIPDELALLSTPVFRR